MKITYYLRGLSNPSTIYLRARTDIHDIRIKTPFKVNPENWNQGKVKKHRIGRSFDHRTKSQLQQNTFLDKLQNNLNELTESISSNYLSNRPAISSQWLRNQINPIEDKPINFSDYIPTYIELSNLRSSTEKKIQSTLNRILKFKDIPLTSINKIYRRELLEHLSKEGYAHNTAHHTIKVIQTICNHAHDNGYDVHPDGLKFSRRLKPKRPPHIYLTPKELFKLESTVFKKTVYEITRDWLLISCYTGQRMGDLFGFKRENLKTIDGYKFIALTQSKTKKSLMVPVNNTVECILNKYNGHFPPLLTKAKASNEVLYNRFLKQVCQEAAITDIVKVNLRNPKTNRYELRKVPKWKAVSSHIGRRSFATNHFGKMRTSSIKTITGHSTERQLLEYIGQPLQETFVDIAREMRQVEFSPLSIIGKTS
ncbi:tyrosine-type recombinase/integrase [Flagellimonas flava]|uniref:Site-specific recombinase XerD n=1 Tax=Flagellimonas flava TaxID=570519 RepID=A0A1M5N7J5_9FLAO|nr:phage integrase SAM-like domain-containing protein [Allomuricauda flava]SHG85576.1 Site-specific recombinase XerD [Allomuricauda flava]